MAEERRQEGKWTDGEYEAALGLVRLQTVPCSELDEISEGRVSGWSVLSHRKINTQEESKLSVTSGRPSETNIADAKLNSNIKTQPWSQFEVGILNEALKRHEGKDWGFLPLKKRPWSEDEMALLIEPLNKHEGENWKPGADCVLSGASESGAEKKFQLNMDKERDLLEERK